MSALTTYKEQKAKLPFLKDHPTQEIFIRFLLCGDLTLKYQALLSIAGEHRLSTQEMLRRIFERGIEKEFEYWKSRQL